MNNYLAVINNPKTNAPAQFKQYNIRCALISNSHTKLIDFLQSQDWHVIVQANKSVLLEK